MSYNNFKSTTVRGSFNNLNYPDNSIKASSYFQNDVSISGQLYTNNINTIYLNGYIISSLINSLSGAINNNTIYNTNYFNTISSYIVYNNNVNTSQNLINNTLSSRINNYIISNNNNINTISSYIVYNNNVNSSIQTQVNNINTLLSNTTYVTNYLKFSNNVQVRILAITESMQLVYPGNIYKYLTLDTLSYLDGVTSPIQTQFQNINNIINTISSYIVNNDNTYLQNQINSLSGSIYFNNNIQNSNIISISSRINNNFNNQNLINISLSSLIYSNNNMQNSNIISISSRINNNFNNQNLINISLSNIIYSNNNIIQNELITNYVTTLYLTTTLFNFISLTALNSALSNYAKFNTNPLYLLDISGNMNAPSIYENNTLLSSKYLGINAVAAVSTRSINVAFTNDTTSTNLCVAMTAASSSTNSAALRLDTNLRYNCVTNALSTTSFVGFLTGSCSGSSTSCSGNSLTSTTSNNVSVTTDTTSTSLYIPLISASSTNSSTPLKVDSNLSFNALTNALTTNSFIGNLTGSSTSIGITEDLISTVAYIPFTLLSTTVSNALLKISSYLGYNPSTNTLKCNHLGSVIVPSAGILNLQDGATSNICPIGCIMMMAQQTTLTGWLVCNGTSLSTTGTYANLFAIIGYTYGGSESLFKVPDFRGAFLRGFSSPGSPRNLSYASGAFGQYQESQIGSHTHTLNVTNNGVNTNLGSAFVPTGINPATTTTTESRPYNYCVEYFIKY